MRVSKTKVLYIGSWWGQNEKECSFIDVLTKALVTGVYKKKMHKA